MNFIDLETSQKLRGGFYTDPDIATFLAKWILEINPTSILEPSCGDGNFFEVIENIGFRQLKDIIGFEIDPKEARKAIARTKLPLTVHNKDFLKWYLYRRNSERRFDAVIGNPPFIRYQYLPEEQQQIAGKIFEQLNLPFTKHTNAWVPFVLASIKLLKPGGRIAMVIPSEIFHIPHASSLRQYLASQCSRILIYDPQDIWFTETLQGIVLLLAEKKHEFTEKGRGVAIINIVDRKDLLLNPEYQFQNALYTNGIALEGKWMPILLSPSERELFFQLSLLPKVKKFIDIASVDVGIVTGANNYFLVPDNIVEHYSLQKWAYPMFGRSDHVKGLIFNKSDYRKNKLAGLPANFLWIKEENINMLSMNVRAYLKEGKEKGIPSRYKCRTRSCWYKVPSVYSTPIALLKRAHNYPRLVLNTAKAFTTDTAYRINPINIDYASFVFGFVNSLTCLSAELEGRHYGGGVLELVPSEIEKLLIPITTVTMKDLKEVDDRYRII